jgi:flavorubredoxin
MKAQKISDAVYCIHTDLQDVGYFEGIWNLSTGVSLNAYLVKGEKTALIDLVEDAGGAPARFEEALASAGSGFSSIDYLVLNHLEPDHTGYLKKFRSQNPGAVIVSTQKGLKLVESFYGVTQGVRAVANGDTLDLGAGQVLTFYETPNVHWPETMMTWHAKSGTLFSCDGFGSFGALGTRAFDDEFSEAEHAVFEKESERYYANIVASFSAFVLGAVKKLADAGVAEKIRCVAPSHGIVWRKDPGRIIDRYVKFANWAKSPEKEIAVIWGSMYGNTKAGMDAVVRGIEAEGAPCTVHRVPDEHISFVLAAAYRSAGLVIAMPTYEYAMFPPMAWTLDMLRRKHIAAKTVLRIGSWGWVGGAKREWDAILAELKWNGLEPVEWPGLPDEETLALLEQRGRELARQVGAC